MTQNAKKGSNRQDKIIFGRILFATVLISLSIAMFFIYDIVFLAMENEKIQETILAEQAEERAAAEQLYALEPPVSETEPLALTVKGNTYFLAHVYAKGQYYTFPYEVGTTDTVLDLLYRCSVFPNENNFLNYEEDTVLFPDIFVEVGQIVYEERTEYVEIPYETTEIPMVYSPYSEKTMRKFKDTEGENGVREITTRVKLIDGEVVETIVLSNKITKQPKTATKYVDRSDLLEVWEQAPAAGEYLTSFECECTAYTYVEEGGMVTYTGENTRVGYVAVDPDVIPIYSRLYIVLDNGFVYGYCEARDIGGAIKGNIIDLFLPSVPDMKNLGRQKGTVYILSYGKDD